MTATDRLVKDATGAAGQRDGQVESGATQTVAAPRRILARFGVPFVLMGLVLLFSVLRPATFPTWENFSTLLATQDILVILAIGTMVPLVAGEFDLSVGFVLGFCAMLIAKTTSHGWPIAPAIALTVAAGLTIGLINGLLVVRVGINAFIATLGSGTLLSGLTLWLSGGTVIYLGIPKSLLVLGRTELGSLQLPIFYMLAVIAAFYYFTEHTPLGRFLYATGGSKEAARLSGLNTGRLTLVAFALSGLLAGFAGLLNVTVIGSADPATGPDFLLPAFAAAFLGATAIRPGRFNVLGTVVAVFLLAVGIDGLQQLGAPLWLPPVFNGTALLVAVGLTVKRSERAYG